ncbi:MAG TPA: ABC transporter substrate-binding protein [Magnetospirillaceae bacterium]|jgi:phospholipid transport system substrate-binding protein
MTVLSRRAFAAFTFCAALCLGIAGARADDAATANDAQNFIHGMADKALVLVNDKNLSDKDRADRFKDLFVQAFDIPEVGKFVLGRHWKTASPTQQKDFIESFEDFTVLTWSTRFKDYSGVSFEIEGSSPADEGYWVVDSLVKRAQGEPLHLGWRIHKVDGAWKITDILVEGVSMALTQRQDFASAIQSSGGTVESLLATMHRKIEELRAGK